MIFLGLYQVGDRVRLADGVRGPKCRVGNVEKVEPEKGGYLVRHDAAEDMGCLGLVDLFGWMESELEPVVRLVS